MTAAHEIEMAAAEPEEVSTDNPIVRWFESLSEDEKAEYDRLAKAGELYGGDVEAELAALANGTHPLVTG